MVRESKKKIKELKLMKWDKEKDFAAIKAALWIRVNASEMGKVNEKDGSHESETDDDDTSTEELDPDEGKEMNKLLSDQEKNATLACDDINMEIDKLLSSDTESDDVETVQVIDISDDYVEHDGKESPYWRKPKPNFGGNEDEDSTQKVDNEDDKKTRKEQR